MKGGNMKRKVLFGLLAVVILAGLLACSTFIKNSYVTLNESKDLYYTAMGIVSDFQAKGVIDQAKRDQINKVAKIYKESHNIAVDALNVYNKTSLAADKDKFSTALATAIANWADVAALINAIKPGTIQATLTK
jgi:predicted Zn-dependent protease